MSRPPKIRISKWELQYKFNNNEGGYKNRMDELEISCSYDSQQIPRGQDPGTTSKIFKFRDNGVTVMILHFFLRTDGSLGASGKFDPKKLMVEGILYYN
jgi:hypothetical protein